MKIKHFSLLTVLIYLLSAGVLKAQMSTHDKDQTQSEFTVLFIGNSLTYTHNLPLLVSQYAETKGIRVNTTMLAKAGYAIIDHWSEGQPQNLIRSNQYDFVVIQQGPSSRFNGYQMLVNDGAKYARLCEEYNARLAYFMVWPSIARYFTFPDVIKNYTAGAVANNAVLIPVGLKWKEHIDASVDYSYYGPDGFHPSRKGSQKAAEIIVNTLFYKPGCNCSSI